jgi:hypothetical protein
LRGQRLLVPASWRPPLDPNEFYSGDLLGMAVALAGAEDDLGRITEVIDGTGTHDVLRVRLSAPGPGGERMSVLLPFVKEVVPTVDVAGRRMEITPPEGLLELAMPEAGAPARRRESAGRREKRGEAKGRVAAEGSKGSGAASSSRGVESG